MHSSDYEKIANLYTVLTEDIGAGAAGSQTEMVAGVNMPDTGLHNHHEHEVTKPQIVAYAREIKQILLELNKIKLSPSIASKLATVTDRINSIDDWLQNNIAK